MARASAARLVIDARLGRLDFNRSELLTTGELEHIGMRLRLRVSILHTARAGVRESATKSTA
jgi:hypothetical protein